MGSKPDVSPERRPDRSGVPVSRAEDPALPHSPIVQRIREDCAEPFVAFEQCLKENQESVLKCSEHVNAFLRCAERVKLPA
ncbi:coiled-coil-helix-coiled-coil-helix domain-containing protein 5-like [Meleagris gallopavo]|uniref:coiled-coil-helix-coiled-coil-helix domain-containing protein 5-like n=1 Tax=Meleagris gallopavo TaxID=9103 RepID=UPI00093D7541|nr:coiled-coil-helix-coiled-coil-helix domain-containing protein 5-like [Meleagris gallopavo]